MAEQDWSAWGGRAPCTCDYGNEWEAATTARQDCPRHGEPGYGPETFIPPPACGCPATDGVIRHQRGTCTDPAVEGLDWYADRGGNGDG